ncbi:NepR family anti-sigma factor [Paracoccus sp. (in: a-proteobacteria)]
MTSNQDEGRKEAIEKQIDENLKRVYEQSIQEKIPDRFLDLLKKLKDQK